jgi:hypothetical protein
MVVWISSRITDDQCSFLLCLDIRTAPAQPQAVLRSLVTAAGLRNTFTLSPLLHPSLPR